MTRSTAWLELYGDMWDRDLADRLFFAGKVWCPPGNQHLTHLVKKFTPHLEYKNDLLILNDFEDHRLDAWEGVIGRDNLEDAVYNFDEHYGLEFPSWVLHDDNVMWNLCLNYKDFAENIVGTACAAFPRMSGLDSELQARIALFFAIGIWDYDAQTGLDELVLKRPGFFTGHRLEVIDTQDVELFDRMIGDFQVDDYTLYLKAMLQILE